VKREFAKLRVGKATPRAARRRAPGGVRAVHPLNQVGTNRRAGKPAPAWSCSRGQEPDRRHREGDPRGESRPQSRETTGRSCACRSRRSPRSGAQGDREDREARRRGGSRGGRGNARRDANEGLKKAPGTASLNGVRGEARARTKIQDLTDKHVKESRRAARGEGEGDPRDLDGRSMTQRELESRRGDRDRGRGGGGDPPARRIIMDGNGRWAKSRRLPRLAGHRAGVQPVRESVRAWRELGRGSPSRHYAFSVEKWKPPARRDQRPDAGAERTRVLAGQAELDSNGVRLRLANDRPGSRNLPWDVRRQDREDHPGPRAQRRAWS